MNEVRSKSFDGKLFLKGLFNLISVFIVFGILNFLLVTILFMKVDGNTVYNGSLNIVYWLLMLITIILSVNKNQIKKFPIEVLTLLIIFNLINPFLKGSLFSVNKILGVILPVVFVFLFFKFIKLNSVRKLFLKTLGVNIIIGIILMGILYKNTIYAFKYLKGDTIYQNQIKAERMLKDKGKLSFYNGMELTLNNKHEEAIKELDLAITFYNEKDKDEVFYNLGNIYRFRGMSKVALGDIDEGLNDYFKGIEYNPKNELMIEEVAKIYFDLKEYDKSLEYYEKIMESNDKSITSMEELVKIYKILNNTNKVEYYENKINQTRNELNLTKN